MYSSDAYETYETAISDHKPNQVQDRNQQHEEEHQYVNHNVVLANRPLPKPATPPRQESLESAGTSQNHINNNNNETSSSDLEAVSDDDDYTELQFPDANSADTKSLREPLASAAAATTVPSRSSGASSDDFRENLTRALGRKIQNMPSSVAGVPHSGIGHNVSTFSPGTQLTKTKAATIVELPPPKASVPPSPVVVARKPSTTGDLEDMHTIQPFISQPRIPKAPVPLPPVVVVRKPNTTGDLEDMNTIQPLISRPRIVARKPSLPVKPVLAAQQRETEDGWVKRLRTYNR